MNIIRNMHEMKYFLQMYFILNIIRNMHEVKFSTIYLLFNITNDILPLAKVIVLVITVVGFKDCNAL